MTTATFNIPDENWAKLCEKIEKLNRRAAKINVQPPNMTEVRVFDEPIVNNTGKTVGYRKMHEVEVNSVPVAVAGWDFIASIDMGDAELGLVINQVPGSLRDGENLPERFRSTNEFCEHCKVMRKRNTIFVLRNQSNPQDYKQIGRNCLGQFLGGVDPQNVLSTMEYVSSFHSLVSGYTGGSSNYNYSLRDVLFITKNVINTVGWCSRKNADIGRSATADIVGEFFFKNIRDEERSSVYKKVSNAMTALSEEERKTIEDEVENAIFWAVHQESDTLSDYHHNLKVVCSNDSLNPKHLGIACSVFVAYGFALDLFSKDKNEVPVTNHVGTVGERDTFSLRVTDLKNWNSDFGLVNLFIFEDSYGNQLSWKTTGAQHLTVGKTYSIMGTVKEHNEWKGRKQTVLTRCKVKSEIA